MRNARPNGSSPLRRNRCGLVIVAGLAASALLLPPAGAQHPATVMVVFHSRLPLYRLPAAVEQEISARVAKICAAKFPHWRYSASTDADFPQLRVELTQESNGKSFLGMSLAAERDQPVAPASTWREALFAPADFILRPVMPTEQEAPEFFSGAFEQRLLSNRTTVRELLGALSEAVPLGRSVALIVPPGSSEKPRAVLPIEWSEHCHEFAESEFVISSKTDTNEKVKLFSAGLSRPLDYKPGQKQFEGVGVQVNFLQKAGDPAPQPMDSGGRAQVLNLTPLEFRLKEPKPYFQSCKADAAPAPTVAP